MVQEANGISKPLSTTVRTGGMFHSRTESFRARAHTDPHARQVVEALRCDMLRRWSDDVESGQIKASKGSAGRGKGREGGAGREKETELTDRNSSEE